MSFIHIVSFSTENQQTLEALTKHLLSLKEECKKDGREVIKSLRGGKQSSKEGKENGMQVVFLMEFESDEDLQWYLWKDPAHLDFKSKVKPEYLVTGVTVLDFEDGKY